MKNAARSIFLAAWLAAPLLSSAATMAHAQKPTMIDAIPPRFQGVWVMDPRHCTDSFPHSHIQIQARGFRRGPELVTRRMIDVPVEAITVMISRPDEVVFEVVNAADPSRSDTYSLILSSGDSQMSMRKTNGDHRPLRLHRCR